jgi:hypothetical protein
MTKKTEAAVTETEIVTKKKGKPVDPNSKQSRARALFQAMHTGATPKRGDVINQLVQDIGLTKAGAATYYQNFKAEAGMVVHKTEVK